MKKAIKLVSAAALVLSFGVAHAQKKLPENFYSGVEVGRTGFSEQTGKSQKSLVSSLGGTASVTQNSPINNYRIFGGHKFSENVNFELGYLQTSNLNLNFSGVTSSSTAYSGSIAVQTAGFDYSVLLRPDVSTGFNGGFLRLGGHSLKTSGKNSAPVPGGTISVETTSGAGVMFGAGYDINIAKNFAARVSATRLNNIAGESDSKGTSYSLAILTRF